MSDEYVDLLVSIGTSRGNRRVSVAFGSERCSFAVRGLLVHRLEPDWGWSQLEKGGRRTQDILARWGAAAGGKGRVLLTLRDRGLHQHEWESAWAYNPHPAHRQTEVEVVRYLPGFSASVLAPLRLPVDVLVGDFSTGRKGPSGWSERSGVLGYFRSATVEKLTWDYLLGLLRGWTFDVVHLRSSPGNDPTVDYGFGAEPTRAALGRAVRKGGVRLLVLEAAGKSDYQRLLDLAGYTQALGGPQIVVIEASESRDGFFGSFYLNIVHDLPLDSAVEVARRSGKHFPVAVFLTEGGRDVLRVSRTEPRLRVERSELLMRAETARRHLRRLAAHAAPGGLEANEPDDGLSRLSWDLEDAISSLESLPDRFDYDRETLGTVPLTEISDALLELGAKVARAERQTARVVNTWFAGADGPLRRDQSLAAGARYEFLLQIGTPSEHSQVVRPRSIPEEELRRFFREGEEELPLEVVLHSSDFEIPEPQRRLGLPRAPAESKLLTIELLAPETPGVARLRASVYYRWNLIQSLKVTARISPRAERGVKDGNRAVVDFALSESLSGLDRLPERELNIAANDSGDGTHTFTIAGTGLSRQFDLGEGLMTSSADATRRQLEALSKKKRAVLGGLKYRFDPDNEGSKEDLVAFLKEFAQLGNDLYVNLVTRQDDDFESGLRRHLGASARIQVAVTGSATYVFPWSMVYDAPLLIGPKNEVCPDFLAHLDGASAPGSLEEQRCLAAGCPHEDDKQVICPSGFWGFKHIIEQPLSVAATRKSRDRSQGDGGEASATNDLRFEIRVDGAPELVFAASQDLQTHRDHHQQVRALPCVVDYQDSKAGISTRLQRHDLQVVYFFCHGGKSGTRAWLGVGRRQRLFPQELHSLEIKSHWQTSRPLVFINGCETADLRPDDLLRFNQVLGWARATGVIGTEISVPETLAREFGQGLLEEYLGGAKIGEAVRRQRLRLLEKRNPLGLAYTCYCYSDTHLVGMSPPPRQ